MWKRIKLRNVSETFMIERIYRIINTRITNNRMRSVHRTIPDDLAT